MKRFEELKSMAETVGCVASVGALARDAERLLGLDRIHVAFVGGQNSGKTTLINGIVGQSVREPDMLSIGEKPLRIAFDDMPIDARFDCVNVVHEQWNRENAVFYELKSGEVLKDGEHSLSSLMNQMDCVFCVVSALAPMTGEDVQLLDLAKFLPVTVVLTKMDALESEDAQRVEDYVADFCRNRGLSQPIVVRAERGRGGAMTAGDWTGCAKRICRAIPLPQSMDELRGRHLDAIIHQARTLILTAAEMALQENQARWKAALLAFQMEDIQDKRTEADWNGLRADMLEKGLALSDEIVRRLEEQKSSIVDVLMDGRRSEDEKAGGARRRDAALAQRARKLFEDALLQQAESVQKTLDADADYMIRRAIWLGLIKDEAEAERIFVNSPEVQTADRVERNFSPLLKRGSLWRGVLRDGAWVWLVGAIPWHNPSLATLATISAATGGVLKVFAESKRWKEEEWRKALTKYVDDNFDAVADAMRGAVSEAYGALADWMALRVEGLRTQFDDSVYDGRSQALRRIMDRLARA